MTADTTSQFYLAALNLQKVYRKEQTELKRSREMVTLFREQRVKAVKEFSKYQFMFSGSYRGFRKDAGIRKPHNNSNKFCEIIEAAIGNGQSYELTRREIEQVFKAYEAAARDRKDPTGTKELENNFAEKLKKLFDDVKLKLTALIVEKVSEEATITPKTHNLESTLTKVDEIIQEEVIKPAKGIIKTEIPKAYKAGNTFGSIQLGAPLEIRKLEWKKIADLVLKSEVGIQGISEEVGTKVKSIIAEGIVNERKFGDIARDIVRTCDNVGIGKATRDARAGIMEAVNKGIHERYAKDGYTEEDEYWLTVDDDGTCDECLDNDGKSIAEIGHYPPEHNGVIYGCRCTIVVRPKLPDGDWTD